MKVRFLRVGGERVSNGMVGDVGEVEEVEGEKPPKEVVYWD